MSVVIDGSAGVTTASGAVYNGLQTATAVASTSGTSITFSSIPSWVKRISILMNAVNTNSSSVILVQVGSGSTTTSGYSSVASRTSTAATVTTSTAGFVTNKGSGDVFNGIMTIALLGSNIWVSTHAFGAAVDGASYYGAGTSPALSGALDRVIITTANGTDTFNAGSINIIYE